MTSPHETIAAAGTGDQHPSRLRRALVALCVTEITSWGVLYYAFPVMLADLTRDTGWTTGAAMAAFSTGAITSALAGIWVGRWIDRYGPRPVMTAGSVLGALAVLALAAAPTLPWFFAAWVLTGLAQSAVLYPPAFTAVTRWYGPNRVRALTVLTLAGGLASTVFAPLTAVLLDHFSWRGSYLVLAGILAVITIPLHLAFLTPAWPRTTTQTRRDPGYVKAVAHSRQFVLLAVAMAAGALGMYAATVNLVPLFTARGIGTHLAAIALGLCGAGQLLGRLGYAALTRRTTPRSRTVAILTAGALSVLALGVLPGPVVPLIALAVVAGAIRGIYTLLQATTVSDRWGTHAYGHLNGIFAAPITATVAVSPAAGALLAERLGSYPTAYGLLAGLTLAAALLAALAGRPRNTSEHTDQAA